MSEEKPIARYKLVILGDGGVGKTTLTQRYLKGVFDAGTKMTIGFDFYVKKIFVDEKFIGLQIWDFAGEREFRTLLKDVLMDCKGAVFLFDITRFSTFKNLHEWLELYQKINQDKEQEIPAILVGSKLDLKEHRTVTSEDGENMKNKWKMIDYVECSSKTGENVDAIFQKIARIMMFIDGKIDEII